MTIINQICLWTIILLILFYGTELFKDRSKSKKKTVKEAVFAESKRFYLLLAYGIVVLRFVALGSIPGGFNQDGAMGAVDALALSEYATDRFGNFMPAHFNAWGFAQMSVFLSYLTVPFVKIWGLNAVAVRMPMLILSLLGMAAVYGIVKEMLSEKAALIALLFTAINPWHFMQSRWAIDCNAFPHLFLIGTYFLLKGIKKQRYYYISMIFYALCMYAYGVAFYMVPFFLLFTCIMLLVCKKINFKQTGLCILVYFGISFPIYGTMLINFMKWETVKLPFVTMQYFNGSVRAADILFFSEEPLKQLVINAKALLQVGFLQKPDLIWNAIDEFGTMYLCTLPLILLGVVIAAYLAIKGASETEKLGSRMLLIYWGCSIFMGISINSVNVNRINIIFYSHIIFAAIAIHYLLKMKKSKVVAVTLLVVYMVQSLLFFQAYFTRWADKMEDKFYADFLDAVEFAGAQNCDYYFITPDTQYTGSWNVSEILTHFALEMDAEYYQGKTNTFNGVENSYGNRFRYKNPEAGEIWSGVNAAYVIKSENLVNFDLHLFAVQFFDDYAVLIPKQFANW
ncbi:MAG: glycosyltransferase family 39 protein [Lachnospiraceae bacterium]|nr:glycosyltransferase family 39 protein [Lachnospiraceae bacterium]